MQLSPNFSLAEFTASATATAQGIANTPGARQIAAMQLLCAKVLEPLRAHPPHFRLPLDQALPRRGIFLDKPARPGRSSGS